MKFKFKRFQKEDLARLALYTGAILGWDTGLGKTIAMFVWVWLKVGWTKTAHGLLPAKAALLVVPGDGHDQTDDESLKHFKTKAVRLDSQETFLRLSRPDPKTGRRWLPPNFYLTSYTQLSGNGVTPFPSGNHSPLSMMSMLHLKESDAIDWFNERGAHYGLHYQRLGVTPESTVEQIKRAFDVKTKQARSEHNLPLQELLLASLGVLESVTPKGSDRTFAGLSVAQKDYLRKDLVTRRYKEYAENVGVVRDGVKCVYSPSLSDLSQDCFEAVVVDEGVKVKEDSIMGLGTRQIRAAHSMVMSATPIKNRFPDIFRLAHFVCGAHEEPTPRFPYGNDGRDSFAEEFMQTERNLTREAETGRSYLKKTPQICNIHRAWRLLGPIVLRRKKADCGEDIVPKRRHVVRVPMGLFQAAVYQFHLKAKYLDRNLRPAIGARLQALRVAAANPTSMLLERPEHDDTAGRFRSDHSYIPKVAAALNIAKQILDRGEQGIFFSAFQDSLDVLSARLNEAGVPHLVLDGRISQKKRGLLAREFKFGPPRALAAGLTSRASRYPIALAGIECMAELHNFHLCNNIALMAYSWAWDKFEQGINRAHRLNSPWPVDIWGIVCHGSVDLKLESNIHEKGDAVELVLDGHLLGEEPAEVNLAELLDIARREFKNVSTIDESELQKDWPSLRASLGQSWLNWHRPFHTVAVTELPLWRKRSGASTDRR